MEAFPFKALLEGLNEVTRDDSYMNLKLCIEAAKMKPAEPW